LLGGILATASSLFNEESFIGSLIATIIFGGLPSFIGLKLIKPKKTKVYKYYEKDSVEEENYDNDKFNDLGYTFLVNDLPADISKIAATTNFIGKNQSITISGKKLDFPMIYTDSTIPKYRLHNVIYLKEKIQFSGTDEELEYSPSYSTISPYSRGKFINWLERGRNDIDIDIGFIFIYFYGLEFRAIYDKLNQKEILWETIRLHKIYKFNNSFKNYSEGLIAWIILSINDFNTGEKETLLLFIKTLDAHSYLFKSGAYIKLGTGKISNDDFFHMISVYEKTSNSKIPRKLGKIFYDYFLCKIALDWSKILQYVKIEIINYLYYCATPVSLRDYSNTKGLKYTLPTATKNKMAKIWGQCIEDLKPYSRKVGKATGNDLFLLLPKELKELYGHPLTNTFNDFATEKENKPCKVSELAEFLNWNYSERLSLKRSKELCETIEQLGYNTEPDSRYSSKSYKWSDSIIFYKTSALGIPQNSNYAIASMLFDLGIYISRADSHLDKEELETVENFIINNFCSDEKEIKRITNRRKLAEIGLIKGIGVAKKLANHLKVGELKKIGNYLFLVAAADGIIDKSELKAINKIFSDFGLDENFLNITLDEYREKVTVEDSTKIKQGEKEKNSGSSIPEPTPIQTPKTIHIDSEKLKTVIKDTEEVKQILTKVFSNDNELKQEEKPILNDKYKLPKNLSDFLNKIIQKDSWGKAELRKLAIENQIMLDSAIEQINYWCDEEVDDYLISEKEENYYIKKVLLTKIK